METGRRGTYTDDELGAVAAPGVRVRHREKTLRRFGPRD